jgi:ubiquinone/menaquinone biosynthesis C-methylase UbiE
MPELDRLAARTPLELDDPDGATPGAIDRPVNWSDELEEFHEEATRNHPLERLTRGAMLGHLAPLPDGATIVEVGCSTGYLLEDLSEAHPTARLIGFDLVMSGLRKARLAMPDVVLAQADACQLPLPDACADAVLSVNLLEHVADDVGALEQIHRVLCPGGTAVLVVPTAPNLYDYYDRFLHHERRYARGEMARKATRAGLAVEVDLHLGFVVYPAFWMVKKRNRRRFNHLEGVELEQKVRRDLGGTDESFLFGTACRVERSLLAHHAKVPFGIRGLTVVRRPTAP